MPIFKFRYPQLIQRNIANLMFPDSKAPTFVNNLLFKLGLSKRPVKDFYRYKGYSGFEDYYNDHKNQVVTIRRGKDKGQQHKNKYSKYFTGCEPSAKEYKVKLASTGEWCTLDSISIKASDEYIKSQEAKNIPLPGKDKEIICFWGTNSYYEAQGLIDMSLEAKATGATMHSFNYPGMNKSTGKAREFNDLVNAGIAVVFDLLKQGKNPDDIILQGNCFGATVAEQVRLHFKEHYKINLRIINSNTFKSVRSVVYQHTAKSVSKKLLYPINIILKILAITTGWNVKHAKAILADSKENYQSTDMIHIQREQDKTVLDKSYLISSKKLKDLFKYESDEKNTFVTYVPEEAMAEHKVKNKDPHLAGLHLSKYKEGDKEHDIFTGVINPFLEKINSLKTTNPQEFRYNDETHGTQPKFKKTAVPRFIRQILIICTISAAILIFINPITLPYFASLLASVNITIPVSATLMSIELSIDVAVATATAGLIALVGLVHVFEWLMFPLFKNLANNLNPNQRDIISNSSKSSDSSLSCDTTSISSTVGIPDFDQDISSTIDHTDTEAASAASAAEPVKAPFLTLRNLIELRESVGDVHKRELVTEWLEDVEQNPVKPA